MDSHGGRVMVFERAIPGVVVYRLRRRFGDQVCEYRLAVTEWEHEHARLWVAFQLREARKELRRFVAAMKGGA